MAKTKYAPFDAADYLDSHEAIVEYLNVTLEDPNPEVFVSALSTAARAHGIAKVAEASGLGRESLYKTLAPGAKPRYETVHKIMQALGVRFVVAAGAGAAAASLPPQKSARTSRRG